MLSLAPSLSYRDMRTVRSKGVFEQTFYPIFMEIKTSFEGSCRAQVDVIVSIINSVKCVLKRAICGWQLCFRGIFSGLFRKMEHIVASAREMMAARQTPADTKVLTIAVLA